MSLPAVTRATLYVPSARARPQVFLIPEKAASVKRLDAVLGKVNLPAGVSSSRAMVVMLKGAFTVSCLPGASPLVYITLP